MFFQDILMCRPDHFAVRYSINPWMKPEESDGKPDKNLALRQWIALHHAIIRFGGFVHYIDPHPDSPDMVFTANGGLVHGNKAVVSRFAFDERRKEEHRFYTFFKNHNLEVLELREDEHFEGNGDAFIVNDTLFLGSGSRSKSNAAGKILDFLGLKKLIICDLIDPRFYHLDTCFCPLNDHFVLYCPDAFSEQTLAALKKEQFRLFPVPTEEALKFACNSIVINKNVIIPSGCPETMKELTYRGYTTCPLDMSEFIKAGGAAKCLTLRI